MKHYSQADIWGDMERDERDFEAAMYYIHCGISPDKTIMECAPPIPGIGVENRCGICGKTIPAGQEWWKEEK